MRHITRCTTCDLHRQEKLMLPTNARLRRGNLGVAHNNRRLLPAFAKATQAELHAISSRSPERARAAAAAAGIPTAYGSYEALLDDRPPKPLTAEAHANNVDASISKVSQVCQPRCGTRTMPMKQQARERRVRTPIWPHLRSRKRLHS